MYIFQQDCCFKAISLIVKIAGSRSLSLKLYFAMHESLDLHANTKQNCVLYKIAYRSIT